MKLYAKKVSLERVNLIHFFDEKKVGAAGNSIVCFGAFIPCHAI